MVLRLNPFNNLIFSQRSANDKKIMYREAALLKRKETEN